MKNFYDYISKLNSKPEMFCRTVDGIWTEPYISKKLLECHLNLKTDATSRNHLFISNSIKFHAKMNFIKPKDKLLDLGCGTGLYAERLSSQDVPVTGIVFSKNSIDFARKSAS